MNIILFSELEDALFKETKTDFVFYKNDERFLHIKKILKLSENDFFKAGKINGKIGEAKIKVFSDEKIIFSFTEKEEPLKLPPIKIILGFPRPIQLKRILRDIASLGFCELFLVGTGLGEASYLKSTLAEKSQIKKYLIDGIVQAGQSLLPEFSFFPSVKDCLQNIKAGENFYSSKKILADIDQAACPLHLVKIESDEEILLAIGSERGWTNTERKIFYEAGFVPSSLGKRILRTETACTAGLAIILSLLKQENLKLF